MIPTRLMFTRIIALMYAYINPLLDDPGWDIEAIIEPFTPGPDLVYADLTIDPDWTARPLPLLHDFSVSGPDPELGGYSLNFANANFIGYTKSTSATPRMVYGFAICEEDGTFVYAARTLPTPISITAVGNFIQFPKLGFNFPFEMFVAA